jgi:hypothetical protein
MNAVGAHQAGLPTHPDGRSAVALSARAHPSSPRLATDHLRTPEER